MIFTKKIDDKVNRRKIQHEEGMNLLKEAVIFQLGIQISERDISRTEFGKPYLAHYSDFHFNITHCEGFAACLTSDCPCGVDAEKIRPVRQSVVRRVMSDNEAAMLDRVDGQEKEILFTALWTLKEAYSKAEGGGISVMSNVSFKITNGKLQPNLEGYMFRTFLDGDILMSVCYKGSDSSKIDFGTEFDFSAYIR